MTQDDSYPHCYRGKKVHISLVNGALFEMVTVERFVQFDGRMSVLVSGAEQTSGTMFATIPWQAVAAITPATEDEIDKYYKKLSAQELKQRKKAK